MSAWHTENKEWMKERKRQWASVSKRVNDLYFIDSEWKPAIKHFFLTGELKKESHNLKNFQFAPFFALWFHPDDSLQNWEHMREMLFDDWQWLDSAARLREVLSGLGELPEGGVGSFFDGRDERLYDFFFKRGLKREHFPEMDDMKFESHASVCYQSIMCSINSALNTERWGAPNPYNSVNYRLEEWRDSIILAYDPERKELEYMLERLDQTLAEPDRFVNERVDLARRVNEVLDDPTLPTEFKQRVKELRERPCHPYCLQQEATVPPDIDALIRIIAGSKKAIARIAKLLEEPTNLDIGVDNPVSYEDNSEQCEFLERPQEVFTDGRQLTAKYQSVDSKRFEKFIGTVHERDDFEIAYILYGDEDKWYYIEYIYPEANLMNKTGDDEEIDMRLREMGWGRSAFDFLIKCYG